MPFDDAWDWPFLLYVCTVILKRSEAEFWKMRPRKLNELAKVHVMVNSDSESNTKAKPGYIDQIF